MKKGFSLIVGMALFLGVATGYADENRIEAVFQEAQQASCADTDKAARRPMCLSETDMLAMLLASGGDEELAAARSGEDTIYTDSCRKPTSNPLIPGNYACNAGLDCGSIDPLCTSHWNQSVPRDLPSVDPGELKEYLNRLWLYSSDGLHLHQTWKNSYGRQ